MCGSEGDCAHVIRGALPHRPPMRHNGSPRRGVFPRAGLVNTEGPSSGPTRGRRSSHRSRDGGSGLRQPHVAVHARFPSGRHGGAPFLPEVLLNVSAGVWITTLVALVAVLAVDLLIIGR